MNSYWESTISAAKEVASARHVEIQPLPMRDNETSSAYSVQFEGHDGYPLFAYLHVPRSDGPHIPLFQAPGYGSVVHVPAYERRATYVVAALCHRGQRHSNSRFQAAYPGLLTHGLDDPEGYIWRDIVADCVTAITGLMRYPTVDTSKLAVTGGDLAWLTAAFVPEVKTLQTGGLVFADTLNRLEGNPDYPLKEFNDFKRSFPDKWETAKATLTNFDAMSAASRIKAESILITCSAAEVEYSQQLADGLSGDATVRVNSGKGHLDHVAVEEWLAEASGTTPGPAHYPRS